MTRRTLEFAWLVGPVCVGMLLIGLVRGRLFASEKEVTVRHDVYFLPPPEQVVKLSLGYRHAFADVLWAHLLVGQGLRIHERRRFDTLLRLYDAINALDPTFRTPYLMADALITFNIIPTTKDNAHLDHSLPYEDVVKAREIMERGVEALPNDAELWLTLGQFVSFIAPASYLEERPEEAKRWRREGVAYLERAVALSGENSSVSWQALGGASILREAGELDASVRFYERAYAVTDDEELRETISRHLDKLRRSRDKQLLKLDTERQGLLDAQLRRSSLLRQRSATLRAWVRAELPFMTRGTADALGPPPRPAACAGSGHLGAECATSWQAWSRRLQVETAAAKQAPPPVER